MPNTDDQTEHHANPDNVVLLDLEQLVGAEHGETSISSAGSAACAVLVGSNIEATFDGARIWVPSATRENALQILEDYFTELDSFRGNESDADLEEEILSLAELSEFDKGSGNEEGDSEEDFAELLDPFGDDHERRKDYLIVALLLALAIGGIVFWLWSSS